MPVILNGGKALIEAPRTCTVPLVDACDTEWRARSNNAAAPPSLVPLVDACDTEWRACSRFQ